MSENKMILLKLGGRKHLGEGRWQDALSIYDEIYSVCCYKEPSCKWDIPSERIHNIIIPHTFWNQKLFGILLRAKGHKSLDWISFLAILGLRLSNRTLIRDVRNIDVTNVLCSYGDYDFSDIMCLVFGNAIRARIIRAYKETRLEYSYTERMALKRADEIVLYDVELKKFLERKYGEKIFEKKKVLLGYDENVLPECILSNINYQRKLSSIDLKVHVAILTFRVDSIPNRERDQGRYYYIDVIRKLINAGIVVHLHCAQYNDDNGVNRYQELATQNPGMFYLESSLEMKHSSSCQQWVESCEILSRYDIGLLHNIVDNSSVSEFDRINVPHRFFAYEAAHVVPIIARGENVVLERIFNRYNCGFVYDKLEELSNIIGRNFDYYTPSYTEYLKAIFDLEDK